MLGLKTLLLQPRRSAAAKLWLSLRTTTTLPTLHPLLPSLDGILSSPRSSPGRAAASSWTTGNSHHLRYLDLLPPRLRQHQSHRHYLGSTTSQRIMTHNHSCRVATTRSCHPCRRLPNQSC